MKFNKIHATLLAFPLLAACGGSGLPCAKEAAELTTAEAVADEAQKDFDAGLDLATMTGGYKEKAALAEDGKAVLSGRFSDVDPDGAWGDLVNPDSEYRRALAYRKEAQDRLNDCLKARP